MTTPSDLNDLPFPVTITLYDIAEDAEDEWLRDLTPAHATPSSVTTFTRTSDIVAAFSLDIDEDLTSDIIAIGQAEIHAMISPRIEDLHGRRVLLVHPKLAALIEDYKEDKLSV